LATIPAPIGGEAGVTAARALQIELAGQVSRRDGFARPLRTIAGFHVDAADDGATLHAAAVLLDAGSLQVLATEVAHVSASAPCAPGLLSFRELPALLLALERLPEPPDLAFVDGHGLAHPCGLGIASHFGVATGLPCVGVARTSIFGSGPEPHQMRGAYTALRHEGTQLGWVLRSKVDRDPLIVSPGHRVSMASAADLVMRCTGEHRLPEPTRLAWLAARGDAPPGR
jgi:deoxyribonuclease V